MKNTYSIEELIKIFKEHSEEFERSKGPLDSFNICEALLSMCESLSYLLEQDQDK